MYQPDHFRVDDVPQMHEVMRDRPFASLISAGSNGLFASHLPTVLKNDGPYGVIECHLARANPHCKDSESLPGFRAFGISPRSLEDELKEILRQNKPRV